MIEAVPDFIGLRLEDVKPLIPAGYITIVKTTLTPFEDKQLERTNTEPVVVRQRLCGNQIELTISYFK